MSISSRVCLLSYAVGLSLVWHAHGANEQASFIRLNTVGYRPDATKVASIGSACTNFLVVRASDGTKVFEAPVSGPVTNSDTSEQLFLADFTKLEVPGEYRLTVPGVGESPAFRVAGNVYESGFALVARGMYLWRCGTAVSGVHNGKTFAHGVCHTNDAWLDYFSGNHEKKESTGGWHDAGDYNKYVVNAGITVGCMLRAWEDFAPAIQGVKLGLPEAGGKLPEFLAEVKWETDWLLKMQFPDGAVAHKVSTLKFGGFILPEQEKEERFFTPSSSAAAADLVAMLAQAARSFKPYDPAYAEKCLAVAHKSYDYLKGFPTNRNANLKGFSTGAYGTRDDDDRLWAAAELWETSGAVEVLRDFETRLRTSGASVREDFDWGNVANLGVVTYLRSNRPGRDEALVELSRSNLVAAADRIMRAGAAHGYGRPFGMRYYWGCNGTVARQSVLLQAAFRLTQNPDYRRTIFDAVHHLLGRNLHGRSYVTGLGFRPPMHPHDRRCGGDTVDDPWPGYLVGGPHPRPENWRDEQGDYRTNEIAINWNGAMIYALAALLQ